jgi:hypothetical protein
MRDHLAAGAEREALAVGEVLGAWVAEMRRRRAESELTAAQREQIDALPGWRWDA